MKRIDAFESIQTADALMSMGRELFAELQMAFHTYEQQTVPESKSSAETHRVINGDDDFKGNPHVVAGEGTGIVHIAPGCGDVDHKIGENRKLAVIAPLKEDGSFGEGFGPFTGRTAVDPKTADLVFEQLKEKGRLVYVEEYPHIYPHCWRTGEELVFRLVDEWFINMDWREEIKEVTKAITWLPDSIQGQEREIEWLSTMRDWMISKKRFWGLALPIWVNPDDASDFEVIGSLAELKERAVEGWEEFEGHTPHRPWIDKVKIKSEKTGAVLTRVEDVGNPWLDAGITPFSTMNYRAWKESSVQSPVSSEDGGASTLDTGHSTLDWSDWYPADFVTECFPGQFRNWFYSLLALSTMMRYDETDDPAEKRPFKTLLGHRLVMDEHGNPMHKSDGTAIWFEEAAEQLGVDTLRWMYLAQNPASDLRFGTRHPDEPVTLSTPEGPISETKEGLPTCKVTSKPADEIRRQVLIPLWNSYAFFVNYAVADEFDPTLEPVPLAERPEIDRWILSRLQELIGTAHESFRAYDVARFMAAATTYIDDLSNWYIRRNRRRFWRSKDASDSDKTAAYQTLHEVLLTLTKLLAPSIPFLAERMYQNLASGGRQSPVTQDEAGAGEVDGALNKQGVDTPRSPGSVHLCDYPTVDESKLDPALNRKTAAVQTLVRLSHRLRETAELRVRQPLAELQFAANDAEIAAALEQSADIIADELNVKTVTRAEHLDELVSYAYKPNLKTLGPKYGKLLGAIRKELPEMEGALLAPLRNGKPVTVTLGGEEVTLEPDDVLVSTEQASDWASGDDAGIQVALSTALTPELLREGMARDFVRHVQQARKDAGLEITDRIQVQASVDEPEAKQAIEEWATYIQNETLADAIKSMDSGHTGKRVAVGPVMINIRVVPVTLKK
ncbi:MAG: class I tRNA ligase family protein [Planctomycetaceae bacterium]